jgi:hypothetical protein
MSGSALESFLASIYVDSEARARFTADPAGEAKRAGLSPQECAALTSLDRNNLELVARSLPHKRQAKQSVKTFTLFQKSWQAVRSTLRLIV